MINTQIKATVYKKIIYILLKFYQLFIFYVKTACVMQLRFSWTDILAPSNCQGTNESVVQEIAYRNDIVSLVTKSHICHPTKWPNTTFVTMCQHIAYTSGKRQIINIKGQFY